MRRRDKALALGALHGWGTTSLHPGCTGLGREVLG